MSTISLTMSLEVDELRENGNMLLEMASYMGGKRTAVDAFEDSLNNSRGITLKVVDDSHLPSDTSIGQDTTIGQEEEQTEVVPTPSITGVELDNAGLPWDARIHGAKKLKTAKDDLWKKIRGVDPELVTKVEAELRAALAAPAPKMEEEALAPAPQPEAPAPAPQPETPAPGGQLTITPNYITPQGNFTEDELVAVGWTSEQVKALSVAPLELTVAKTDDNIAALSNASMTFPEFMAKVTREQAAGEIDQAAVLAAVNAAGLASLPLLATRPDLIPQIDTALFGE